MNLGTFAPGLDEAAWPLRLAAAGSTDRCSGQGLSGTLRRIPGQRMSFPKDLHHMAALQIAGSSTCFLSEIVRPAKLM